MAVSIDQTATQFVNTINSDIENAAQSGGGGSGSSGSAISRTVKLQMQGGRLVDGYTEFTTTDSLFKNSIHSILMMNIEGCTITSVGTESGETLTIFCYDGSGAYTESVNSISDIDSETCFVKFMLSKSNAYTYLRQLSVTVTGKPSFVKNTVPQQVIDKRFSFEVTFPSKFEPLANNAEDFSSSDLESGYIGVNNNTRYYDNGYIKLPPNYSPDGAPVPLVVYIHGSNGFGFDGVNNGKYGEYRNFIVNNGYALCDCSGLTNADHYKGTPSYSEADTSVVAEDVFFAPSFISCIKNLVDHITANYNVKEDGVYIFGKSSGGYTLHMLTQTHGLNIKAAASLAPAISTFANMRYYINYDYSSTCRAFRQLGVTEPTQGDANWGNASSGNMKLILDNIHALRQIDPMFVGTDLTDAQVAELVQNVYGTGVSNYKYNFNNSSACMAVLNSAVTHVTVPTKIWIASDDSSVSYGESKLYVAMAQRGGSQCYLRRMATGTGGHNSVDSNGIKVNYRPKYSDTLVNIPVAYAELVDWFNRW